MLEKNIVKMNREYSLFSWCIQSKINPISMETAEGSYFFSADGKRYFDLASQSVNCNIGHQHPKVIDAMKEQIDKLTFAAPYFANSVKGETANKIIGLLPDNYGKVFFTNAGADAIENAVKMARMFTGKHKIISRYRSYHGATAGAGTITGDPRRWVVEPGIPGTIKCFDPYCYNCPFGKTVDSCKLECATHIEDIIMYEGAKNVAAVIIETVTGTNLMMPPPVGYLRKLREICDRNNVLLVLDEIMCGFGRTGKMFAFEHYNIKPDMVAMAKGLTSGYAPLGAIAVSADIANYFENNMLTAGLTYSGHTLGVATAKAVIRIMEEENMVENAHKVGEYVEKCLKYLFENHPCIGDVRGIGLMHGVELVYDRVTREPMCPFGGGPSPLDELDAYLEANGVKTMIHWNLILFAPPLIVNNEQIDWVIEILDKGLSLMDKYVP